MRSYYMSEKKETASLSWDWKEVPDASYFEKLKDLGIFVYNNPLFDGDMVGVIFSLKELSKSELTKIAKKEIDDE